jgi:hypothetical protein
MTDTKHRQIFRFHRRDIFTNLLSNICMSDEMLPCPRHPTNPWTNERLTMPQTMALCQQLLEDFARRGVCPPVLFAGFWAARFNVKRFLDENSALLSQHAIRSYFKDIHDGNQAIVFDTIITLLANATVDYSPANIRRWLRQSPVTSSHREWLAMARDYTLYINLHVQVRPSWHSDDHIFADVRRLYSRTPFPDMTSQRLRTLRSPTDNPGGIIPPASTLYGLLGLPLILQPPGMLQDVSGSLVLGSMSEEIALRLIRNSLFRM